MTIVILLLALIVVLALVACFALLAVQAGVPGSAAELIADAEELNASGASKMAFVVQSLAANIPAALRSFFTDERLQRIAQGIFVFMRKYARAYEASQQIAAADAPPEAENAGTESSE